MKKQHLSPTLGSLLAGLVVALGFMLTTSCEPNNCHVTIGKANFSCNPNSAAYPGLNHVGGYEAFTGGHRGIMVIRLSQTDFVAFERTCPCDNNSRVEVSADYGYMVLQCPTCGSLFSVNDMGFPMTGSSVECPLHQYSTNYTGGTLYVY